MHEYTQLVKKVTIPAGGSEEVTLEMGVPYKNYTAWVYAGAATPTLSVQPMFGGFVDGAAVAINAPAITKVRQISTDELRPSTRPPGVPDIIEPLKSSVIITNGGGAPYTAVVWLLASPIV